MSFLLRSTPCYHLECSLTQSTHHWSLEVVFSSQIRPPMLALVSLVSRAAEFALDAWLLSVCCLLVVALFLLWLGIITRWRMHDGEAELDSAPRAKARRLVLHVVQRTERNLVVEDAVVTTKKRAMSSLREEMESRRD